MTDRVVYLDIVRDWDLARDARGYIVRHFLGNRGASRIDPSAWHDRPFPDLSSARRFLEGLDGRPAVNSKARPRVHLTAEALAVLHGEEVP